MSACLIIDLKILLTSYPWLQIYLQLTICLKAVCKPVKLLLAFASTVIPGFILFEIHDQNNNSLLPFILIYRYMCFEMAASISMKEKSFYVDDTFVAPQLQYKYIRAVMFAALRSDEVNEFIKFS
jgi:hypothetical protein